MQEGRNIWDGEFVFILLIVYLPHFSLIVQRKRNEKRACVCVWGGRKQRIYDSLCVLLELLVVIVPVRFLQQV